MSADAPLALNLVVLVGQLSRPATVRLLPSGDPLVAYELRLPRPGARAENVPVVWLGAPAWAGALDVDDEILVLGRVRRRFYYAGGRTQSRTEVVAERIVRTHHHHRVQAALTRVRTRLEGL